MDSAGDRQTSNQNLVFVGLVLAMLVAVTNQTMVSPAMPVIVAELGGVDQYAWIASSALLAAAVGVPVVGKLSDVHGRRGFYVAGLAVFMLGSVLAGLAPGFWWLVAARAVQGLGMGAIQTLSLTVLGEIVSPASAAGNGLPGRRVRRRPRRGTAGWRLDRRRPLLALALLRQPAPRRRPARSSSRTRPRVRTSASSPRSRSSSARRAPRSVPPSSAPSWPPGWSPRPPSDSPAAPLPTGTG